MNFGGWSTGSVITLVICITIAIGCSVVTINKKKK